MQATANAWQRFSSKLEAEWTPRERLHPLVEDPSRLFQPLGWELDAWQSGIISDSSPQMLVLCPRQTGKSLTSAAKSLITAYTRPRSLSAVISRSQHQAAEVLLKANILHNGYTGERNSRRSQWVPRSLATLAEADDPVDAMMDELERDSTVTVRDSVLSKEFANGSRITAMACRSETTVGSTTDLLVLDEAARMPDNVYLSLRPTLAIAQSSGHGRLLVLSTPFGKRGWFWEAWDGCRVSREEGREPDWEQVSIRVEQCPRITQAFLSKELRAMGARWYAQEYKCDFADAVDQVFRSDDIERAFSEKVIRYGLPEAVEV